MQSEAEAWEVRLSTYRIHAICPGCPKAFHYLGKVRKHETHPFDANQKKFCALHSGHWYWLATAFETSLSSAS